MTRTPPHNLDAERAIIGTAAIWQANALALPIPNDSIDLIVTSPPYFALRSYKDGGEHYDGQLGDEATPTEFIDALIAATREMMRVLKPSGSIWVNLGDKYSRGSRPKAQPDQFRKQGGFTRNVSDKYSLDGKAENTGIAGKSLIGIPWRYAIRCIDELGLILRAEVIWSKPNGLPESVTDRVRRSHEQWFHFTKGPQYFAAVDEIREPHAEVSIKRAAPHRANVKAHEDSPTIDMEKACHPLGKLPGSVWTIPTEPLKVDPALGVDHFAAFPTEWPRRIILGWSPSSVCEICGEGLRPVVHTEGESTYSQLNRANGSTADNRRYDGDWNARTKTGAIPHFATRPKTIVGYKCSCGVPVRTRPAVVLDPFCGTGTTVAVAKALGRHGVGTDLSADYLRLAEWRCNGDGFEKVLAKVTGRKTFIKQKMTGQMGLDL